MIGCRAVLRAAGRGPPTAGAVARALGHPAGPFVGPL